MTAGRLERVAVTSSAALELLAGAIVVLVLLRAYFPGPYAPALYHAGMRAAFRAGERFNRAGLRLESRYRRAAEAASLADH